MKPVRPECADRTEARRDSGRNARHLNDKVNVMKKIIRTAFAAGLAIVLAAPMMSAQNRLGLNVFAGSAFPTDDEPNSDAYYGGGASLKYFLDEDHLAVGGGVRYYARSSEGTFLGVDYNLSSYVMPVHVMAEYYFSESESMARPYVGSDIGVYMFGVSGSVEDADFEPDPESFFGVTPKLGLQLNIGEQLGAFGEFGYNVVFDKQDESGDGSPANADFQDVATEFFSLHIGAALRF